MLIGHHRYNTFFVLYPVGISSEVILIYSALEPAARFSSLYWWFLVANLVIYVPGRHLHDSNDITDSDQSIGSYILYTHMMSQRRRVMKGKSKSK